MNIEVITYTKEQYLEVCEGMTTEEFTENYGVDAVKLFFTRTEDDECPFVGVMCEDGSCNVYGLNADEEYVTFGRMMERLVGYFA